MKRSQGRAPFDAEYFHRFYESRKTRVYDPTEIANLAMGIAGFVRWFGSPLTSVLDVGAGSGMMRDWFKLNLPNVAYRSVDVSAYACERYGHEQRDIACWRDRRKYDLVLCQGVLPYLDDGAADAAIANLAAMAKGFLYFEAVTERDFDEVCNLERTDRHVHVRSGRWYRSRLGRHFLHIGCGLHYVRTGSLGFYELEASG